MSDRSGTDKTLTVRPGKAAAFEAVREPLLKWLNEHCSHYVMAHEVIDTPDTQHWQCALILTEPRRSDHLKATLIGILGGEWNEPMKQHGIRITKHHDILGLAGGYCSKQDENPYIKGWSEEELEAGCKKYKTAKETKERKQPSSDKIVNILREFHDDIILSPSFIEYQGDAQKHTIRVQYQRQRLDAYNALTPHEKVGLLFKLAISNGYDLHKFNTLQWKLYFRDNFEILFDGQNAADIFDTLIIKHGWKTQSQEAHHEASR